MNEILILRLFAEVDTEKSASIVAERIMLTVSKYVVLERVHFEKYWKIPSDYEIFLKLKPLHGLPEDYERVLEILASGWTRIKEYDSVWNQEGDRTFVVDKVSWAHLEGIALKRDAD
jgi:hypothetical protein